MLRRHEHDCVREAAGRPDGLRPGSAGATVGPFEASEVPRCQPAPLAARAPARPFPSPNRPGARVDPGPGSPAPALIPARAPWTPQSNPQATEVPEMPALAQPGRDLR